MKDSTKRTLRTLVQGVIGAAAATPVVASLIHVSNPRLVTIEASVVAAAVVVTKVVNALEDKGIIPTWLKGGDPE